MAGAARSWLDQSGKAGIIFFSDAVIFSMVFFPRSSFRNEPDRRAPFIAHSTMVKFLATISASRLESYPWFSLRRRFQRPPFLIPPHHPTYQHPPPTTAPQPPHC